MQLLNDYSDNSKKDTNKKTMIFNVYIPSDNPTDLEPTRLNEKKFIINPILSNYSHKCTEIMCLDDEKSILKL